MQPTEFFSDLDLSSLVGMTVNAYAQDDGYWHLFVALRLHQNDALIFSTEERSAAPRFEVFPIAMQREAGVAHAWRALPVPIVIQSVIPLWRNEWIERGAVGATVGVDPATQYAGRGPASVEAIASARVLSGILISDVNGQRMVVAASDSAPFNVEIFLPGEAAEQSLEGFEPL